MKKWMQRARDYYRVLGPRRAAHGVLSAIMHVPPVQVAIQPAASASIVYLRVPSSDVRVYAHIFVQGQYDVEVLTSPGVIVDAGAHIGLASVYFANRFPNCRIIAIEPEPGNFSMLQKNVAVYPNVLCLRGGLWERNEEVELVDPGHGNWGFVTRRLSRQRVASGRLCCRVSGMTLDRIMAEHNITFIDILKVDIEGTEHEVFREPTAWVGNVGSLIIEPHERMRPGCIDRVRESAKHLATRWTRGELMFMTGRQGCIAAPDRNKPLGGGASNPSGRCCWQLSNMAKHEDTADQ